MVQKRNRADREDEEDGVVEKQNQSPTSRHEGELHPLPSNVDNNNNNNNNNINTGVKKTSKKSKSLSQNNHPDDVAANDGVPPLKKRRGRPPKDITITQPVTDANMTDQNNATAQQNDAAEIEEAEGADEEEQQQEEQCEEPKKRGRGRPRKQKDAHVSTGVMDVVDAVARPRSPLKPSLAQAEPTAGESIEVPKRGRGRPPGVKGKDKGPAVDMGGAIGSQNVDEVIVAPAAVPLPAEDLVIVEKAMAVDSAAPPTKKRGRPPKVAAKVGGASGIVEAEDVVDENTNVAVKAIAGKIPSATGLGEVKRGRGRPPKVVDSTAEVGKGPSVTFSLSTEENQGGGGDQEVPVGPSSGGGLDPKVDASVAKSPRGLKRQKDDVDGTDGEAAVGLSNNKTAKSSKKARSAIVEKVLYTLLEKTNPPPGPTASPQSIPLQATTVPAVDANLKKGRGRAPKEKAAEVTVATVIAPIVAAIVAVAGPSQPNGLVSHKDVNAVIAEPESATVKRRGRPLKNAAVAVSEQVQNEETVEEANVNVERAPKVVKKRVRVLKAGPAGHVSSGNEGGQECAHEVTDVEKEEVRNEKGKGKSPKKPIDAGTGLKEGETTVKKRGRPLKAKVDVVVTEDEQGNDADEDEPVVTTSGKRKTVSPKTPGTVAVNTVEVADGAAAAPTTVKRRGRPPKATMAPPAEDVEMADESRDGTAAVKPSGKASKSKGDKETGLKKGGKASKKAREAVMEAVPVGENATGEQTQPAAASTPSKTKKTKQQSRTGNPKDPGGTVAVVEDNANAEDGDEAVNAEVPVKKGGKKSKGKETAVVSDVEKPVHDDSGNGGGVATKKKKGRPPKQKVVESSSKEVEEGAVEDAAEVVVTAVKKRGRPRKDAAALVTTEGEADETEQEAAVVDSAVKKRYKPLKPKAVVPMEVEGREAVESGVVEPATVTKRAKATKQKNVVPMEVEAEVNESAAVKKPSKSPKKDNVAMETEAQVESNAQAVDAPAPKKPKGRPKKSKGVSAEVVEDSEEERENVGGVGMATSGIPVTKEVVVPENPVKKRGRPPKKAAAEKDEVVPVDHQEDAGAADESTVKKASKSSNKKKADVGNVDNQDRLGLLVQAVNVHIEAEVNEEPVKRRGRPPKIKAAAVVAEAEEAHVDAAAEESQEEPVEATVKRRGRPPKNKEIAGSKEVPAKNDVEKDGVPTPKKKGRPPKKVATAHEVNDGVATVKRRGRPPKSATTPGKSASPSKGTPVGSKARSAIPVTTSTRKEKIGATVTAGKPSSKSPAKAGNNGMLGSQGRPRKLAAADFADAVEKGLVNVVAGVTPGKQKLPAANKVVKRRGRPPKNPVVESPVLEGQYKSTDPKKNRPGASAKVGVNPAQKAVDDVKGRAKESTDPTSGKKAVVGRDQGPAQPKFDRPRLISGTTKERPRLMPVGYGDDDEGDGNDDEDYDPEEGSSDDDEDLEDEDIYDVIGETRPVDLYGLFSVDRDASEEDIRRAYYKACLEYHPAKIAKIEDGIDRAWARNQLNLLIRRYHILSDDTHRARYDQIWRDWHRDPTSALHSIRPFEGWQMFYKELWPSKLTPATIEEFRETYQDESEYTDI
ncbi:hypothetical protein HDU76_000162 [Blyttiomyces sp. JEL0837]|nr:hypothetical protein HDU76_000162 [Blyttiomyces sp. JEL0837]